LAVPAGTPISQVFDEGASALLILGGPGTGKTTLLLELALDLLQLAEQDESRSIPTVFNLSSWAVRRQPLRE
jgi:predicted NACHT family NTPase